MTRGIAPVAVALYERDPKVATGPAVPGVLLATFGLGVLPAALYFALGFFLLRALLAWLPVSAHVPAGAYVTGPRLLVHKL